MTAIGLVPPGLPGNQLLGNQSIFDLENWLLAPPPSPLRGSCAPLKTDTKFSQASRVSSSQPKNTQAQRHYINSEGVGRRGLTQFNCYCCCRGVSFMTSVIVFWGGNSLTDKSHFLRFFLSPEVSDSWTWKTIHITVLLFWRQNQMVLFGRSLHTPSLVANTYMKHTHAAMASCDNRWSYLDQPLRYEPDPSRVIQSAAKYCTGVPSAIRSSRKCYSMCVRQHHLMFQHWLTWLSRQQGVAVQ